jgi:DNA invertase Pin-like site-specific DNA recombinase
MQHCNGQVAAEFTEIESGKRSDRPQLVKAIARARALRATLIVAHLDRLARNVKFVATLMDSGVEFTTADIPQANSLTLHIVAAVAEAEGRAISERTRLALAQAKKKGTRLGTRRRGHLAKINWRKGWRNGLNKAVAAAAAN